MAKSTIQPRSFLESPASFGDDLEAKWLPWAESQQEAVAAAYFQHRLVRNATRQINKDYNGILAQFAEAIGQHKKTLPRKFSGERPIVFDDLISWTLALGTRILPSYSNRDEMLPVVLVRSS